MHIDWTADQGSTNIHSGNYINTQYSVGDGGLTTNDFTNADHTKLNGIAANATATLAPHYTSAIPNATASATGLATSTQITKLDGIAAGATNTAAPYYTVLAILQVLPLLPPKVQVLIILA